MIYQDSPVIFPILSNSFLTACGIKAFQYATFFSNVNLRVKGFSLFRISIIATTNHRFLVRGRGYITKLG